MRDQHVRLLKLTLDEASPDDHNTEPAEGSSRVNEVYAGMRSRPTSCLNDNAEEEHADMPDGVRVED